MAVHPGRGEHMRAVHRHALRLVDGGGVAVIDMGVVFGIERDLRPSSVRTAMRCGVRLLDGAQTSRS
jgi:hypothetical protein